MGIDYGIAVFGNSKLTVSDGIVKSTHAYAANYSDGNAIATNGSYTEPTAQVNITGGTITSNNVAVYIPSGELTVEGENAKITGSTGIYFKSTKLDISGGLITGSAVKTAYAFYGDGCYATGDALVIDNCNYPNGLAGGNISITGGTFTSGYADAVGSYYGNGKNAAITEFIKGGYFSSDPEKFNGQDGSTLDLVAPGCGSEKQSSGYWTIVAETYTLTVTSSGSGEVGGATVSQVTGGGKYAEGSSVKVTTTQPTGYEFVGWYNADTGKIYADDAKTPNYTFDMPAKELNLVAVFRPGSSNTTFQLIVNGSSYKVIGVDGVDEDINQTSTQTFDVPVNTSVTIEFTGSEEFLYWANSSNKIVSTGGIYTFTMVANTTLTSYYYNPSVDNSAQLMFVSADTANGQVIRAYQISSKSKITRPAAPSKMGHTFRYWTMDGSTEASDDDIKALIGNAKVIKLYPYYVSNGDNYTVTVNSVKDSWNSGTNVAEPYETESTEVGKGITLSAKEDTGYKFNYWTDSTGAILGYTSNLFIRPTKTITVYAVYSEKDVEKQPVVTMTDIYASVYNAEKYRVSFTATRSIPDDCTVAEAGVLYTYDGAVAGMSNEQIMNFLQTNTSSNVKKGKDSSTSNVATITMNTTTVYANRTFYAIGYVIYTKDGVSYTIFSENLVSGSYTSLTSNN
jgi:uncharacterized repeat protein (TIGR02543 family)